MFCFEGNEGGHSSQLPGRESGMTRVQMFDKAAYMREYRRKNHEKIAARLREWRRKNPEEIKEYRRKNREKIAATKKEWRRKNREKIKEY